MRAAVFGSNGYIGKHLVSFLAELGWTITGLGYESKSEVMLNKYIQIDICNRQEVENLDYNFDFIFYFAGLSGTFESFDHYEKYLLTNEMGLLNLLNCLKSLKKKPHLIFPSTRLVYKGIKNRALNEESEKECKSIYAINKYSAEQYLKCYALYFGVHCTVFRICVVYGNSFLNEQSYGTISFFLKRAKSRQPITIFGNGELKRSYTHVLDICKQIIVTVLTTRKIFDVFNVLGETYSLKNVALYIGERYGVQVEHVVWPTLALKMESGDTIFDSTKIVTHSKVDLTYNLKSWIQNLK